MEDLKVIFDTGSFETRVGTATTDEPAFTFPSVVGSSPFPLPIAGTHKRTFVGHDAQQRRGLLTMKNTVADGCVTCWDDMGELWDYSFNQLQVASEDCTLLVTDLYNHNARQRALAIKMLFERFNVRRLFMASQQILSLYGAGETTGCVVDSGHTSTSVVPIFEGYRLMHTSQQMKVGGADVEDKLSKLCCLPCIPAAVRKVKEETAFAALDCEAELKVSHSHICTLPDGTVVDPGAAAFQCVENVLFHPNGGVPSVSDLTATAVQACEIDLRRNLYNNIVLAGGNTMITGFKHRLRKDLSEMVPAGVEVNVIAKEQRQNLAYVGGSILSQLSAFDSQFVPRQVYEESGVDACVRSFF